MKETPEPGMAEAHARLDAIGLEHNTDKASSVVKQGERRQGHDVLRHYEPVIASLGARRLTVLDLGVGLVPDEFASARTWVDHLGDARVVAVDVRQPTVPTPAGVELIEGDLGDPTFLISLAREVRPDVVVEDASHYWQHQLLSLVYLLPAVTPGGVYIWEDLHVARPQLAEQYGGGLSTSPVDFLADLARAIVTSRFAPQRGRVVFTGQEDALSEALVAALAPLVDEIIVFGDAAIIRRRS